MADNDAENESPPLTPRPMFQRVLAAIAIAAILFLSMYVVLRAGHNFNKQVKTDFATSIPKSAFHLKLTPSHSLTEAQLRADAALLQRRARALGYVAYAVANHGKIDVGTTKQIAPADVRTLTDDRDLCSTAECPPGS